MYVLFNSAFPLLGVYPIDRLAHVQNDACSRCFSAELFEMAKD